MTDLAKREKYDARDALASERIATLRARYSPTVAAFCVTAVVLGYLAGWPIREYVQHFTRGAEAAEWFKTWQRDAWQYAIGLALAYPVLRWRFTRMCRKALRLSPEQWKRYASAGHFWRRLGAAALLFGWPLVESINTWLDVRGFGWAFVQMILLAIAVFFIDWDVLLYELPRRALAAMSKRYTD